MTALNLKHELELKNDLTSTNAHNIPEEASVNILSIYSTYLGMMNFR